VTPGTWQPVGTRSMAVPARPATGIWTPVVDYITGPRILRIAAEGMWKPAEGLKECSPDGFQDWFYGRDWLLTKDAPLGALIGKIGGSRGSDRDAAIFPVGSFAVIMLDKQMGPLYLTINDAPAFFHDNSGTLRVMVEDYQPY
jgi:hypothetical protein